MYKISQNDKLFYGMGHIWEVMLRTDATLLLC